MLIDGATRKHGPARAAVRLLVLAPVSYTHLTLPTGDLV